MNTTFTSFFYLVKPQPVAKMLRHSNGKPAFLYFKSLLVERLWYTILTPPPPFPFPFIQSCSTKYGLVLLATLIRGGGGGGITSTRSWTGHLSKNEGQCLKYFCNWLQLYRKKRLQLIIQRNRTASLSQYIFYYILLWQNNLISTHMIKVFRGWY